MSIDTGLRSAAMGLPLVGALAFWLWKSSSLRVYRWLAIGIFALIALFALALSLLNAQYACVLVPGSQNCLFDGFASLSLFLLCLVLARGCLVRRVEAAGNGYILILLLSSAWAGLMLAQNLLVFIIALNLFWYVMYKGLKANGIRWGFFAVFPDQRDPPK